MKIAMFTDSFTPYISGVVRSIQRFSAGLSELGHQVYIFAPAYSRNMRTTTCSEHVQVFRFYSVPAPTCPNFSLPIPFSFRADRLVKRLEIDVIHTHSPFLMGQLGAVLSRKHHRPLVFTHHTLYHEYAHYIPTPRRITQQMIINYLQRYCRHCDHVIAPTPDVQDLLTNIYHLDTPISAIPTGIDLSVYETSNCSWLQERFGIPEHCRIILFIGRLGQEKNPMLVLKTFALLAMRFPDLHLVFVGDGPERASLVSFAQEHPWYERVHFTGNIDAEQVANCCSSAHLFLFGSETETQGLVLGEAMAGGLPVIAVEATGTSDMVNHNYNGYLTTADPEKLADYTRTLLLDEELYLRMRRNALRSVQELSITKTSGRLLQVYQNLHIFSHSLQSRP